MAQQAVYAPVRAGYTKCIFLGVVPSICKAGLDTGIARRRKEELPGALAGFALTPIALLWLIIWIGRWVKTRLAARETKGFARSNDTGRDEWRPTKGRSHLEAHAPQQTERKKPPWYRAYDYKDNIPEAVKRELDAFRKQPEVILLHRKHDLPQEQVRDYIGQLEIDLYDKKQEAAVAQAMFASVMGALPLFRQLQRLARLPSVSSFWSYAGGVLLLVVPWWLGIAARMEQECQGVYAQGLRSNR